MALTKVSRGLLSTGIVDNSNATAITIDSSENVGIKEGSPSATLHTNSGTGNIGIHQESTDSGSYISFSDNSTTSISHVLLGAVANDLVFNAGDAERMRIDSSGNLLVGKTDTSIGVAGSRFISNGQVQATASGQEVLLLNRLSSDGELLNFRKDSTTVGAIGNDSNNLYVVFSQTNNIGLAGGGPATIFPVGNNGAVRDNAIDLGYASGRFDDIYATNGTINTSDRNEKQDIEALSDAEQRVAVTCKGLLRKFRWINSVQENGDDARIHFGIIAQDLQAAFEAEGLDAGRYAMFISSTWTDEDGNEQTRLGVRYSELLAFIISAI